MGQRTCWASSLQRERQARCIRGLDSLSTIRGPRYRPSSYPRPIPCTTPLRTHGRREADA